MKKLILSSVLLSLLSCSKQDVPVKQIKIRPYIDRYNLIRQGMDISYWKFNISPSTTMNIPVTAIVQFTEISVMKKVVGIYRDTLTLEAGEHQKTHVSKYIADGPDSKVTDLKIISIKHPFTNKYEISY